MSTKREITERIFTMVEESILPVVVAGYHKEDNELGRDDRAALMHASSVVADVVSDLISKREQKQKNMEQMNMIVSQLKDLKAAGVDVDGILAANELCSNDIRENTCQRAEKRNVLTCGDNLIETNVHEGNIVPLMGNIGDLILALGLINSSDCVNT